MKFLLNVLEHQKATLFGPGKPLEKLFPLFDAGDTFLFSPVHKAAKAPFVRDSVDTKRWMSMVIVALLPCLLFGIYNAGYQSQMATNGTTDFVTVFTKGLIMVVPLVITSYAVGGLWEGLFAIVRRHPINEGFLVTGLLFPLSLPPTLPLWQAAIGISFGVVIGKEVFGGTGMNILNPALVARAFCFFTYPGKMSGDSVWVYTPDKVWWTQDASTLVDGYSGATALAKAAAAPGGSEKVLASLNESYFTFKSLFYGFVPGSIGETSTLACLIGAGFLFLVGVGSYRTVIACFAGGAFASFLLSTLVSESLPGIYHLPPMYQLVMGGFAFGAVYMATDPVSSAATNTGKWIYGFLIGVIAILIRVVNPAYPEGMMLAILFMNIFAPFIDYWVVKAHINKRRAHNER